MSFQQGLSGLNAAATSLDVIGNNIANANTIGAKSARAEFADMYANALTGGGNNSIGIGVQVATVAQLFTQGDIVTTSNPLDLAINGPGFFQVSANGADAYTRNGQFKVNSDGFIVTTAGARLQGFVADENGNLGQVPTDMQLRVNGLPPSVTQNALVALNLDASASVPTATFNPADPNTYSGVTSMTVYSEQGQDHTLALYFRKTADNAWDIYGTLDGVGFPATPPAYTAIQSITFNPDGTILTPSALVPIDIPFAASEGGTESVSFDLLGITQFGAPFTVTNATQDGFGPGDLAGFNIGGDGTILARYSNGRTLVQGQVTLVNFRNVQGLAPMGGNLWAETGASGQPLSPQPPGTGSLGPLQSGALENSNVDLSNELVNLITAQRTYQANAQTIQAQDQVLQTIVNI